MFKQETVDKVVKALVKATKEYMLLSPSAIKMCISKGNDKIGKVLNVSLAPIITCANCACCRYYCYDVNACARYAKTVIDARARNTALFKLDRDDFFNRIDAAMARRRGAKALRFHVSGDIVDYDHFLRMMAIARKYAPQGWRIWTYTKHYSVINRYIREHGGNKRCVLDYMTVMFSEWRGVPMDNPYEMPVFTCIMRGEAEPVEVHICPGNCELCLAAGRGCVVGETSAVHEH